MTPQDKQHLEDFIKKYGHLIAEKKFNELYDEVVVEDGLTELLYDIGIDPLQYLPEQKHIVDLICKFIDLKPFVMFEGASLTQAIRKFSSREYYDLYYGHFLNNPKYTVHSLEPDKWWNHFYEDCYITPKGKEEDLESYLQWKVLS